MGQSNGWKNGRLAIGVLTEWVDSRYQANLLRGVFDYAREHGVNALCFEGGAINSNREYEVRPITNPFGGKMSTSCCLLTLVILHG